MSLRKIMAVLLSVGLCLGTALPSYAQESTATQEENETETQAEEASEVSFIQNVSYIEDGNEDHMLDIHGVEESGEIKPLIIEVHGGAYISGNKEINTEHSEFYADNGFAVINTNYTHLPTGTFKTVVQELFTVLHWAEENAEEYHFDMEHVFLSGDSAGGFFVNLMAAVLSSEDLQEYYEVSLPSYEIKGYVLTCPGADIMALRDGLNAEDEESGISSFVAEKIGEEILMDDDIMNHADLYSIIDPETFPEVYILTTPTDTTLYSETYAFHEYLTENNIAHQYTEYEGTENEIGHVFNIINMDYAESKQANQDIVAYLNSLL